MVILSINQLPDSFLNEEHFVPLYHYTGKPETYTITMTDLANFPGGYTIVLIDSDATPPAEHLLNTGPYTFLGDPADNSNDYPGDAGRLGSDRFKIFVVPAAGSENPSYAASNFPSKTPSFQQSSKPSAALGCGVGEILVTAAGVPFETSICRKPGTCHPARPPNFYLQLSSGGGSPKRTEIGITYQQGATEYFDGNFDALYLRPISGPNPNPNFKGVMLASVIQYEATNTDMVILSINQLPDSFLNEEHFVPLYHYTGKPETYTITMTDLANFPGGYTIVLIDSDATPPAEHLLNTGPYTFLGDPADNSNDYPGDAGKLGSDRFKVLVVPTIEGYASCQFDCGAAKIKKDCRAKDPKAAGCIWLRPAQWPPAGPDGKCVNPATVPTDCGAMKKQLCQKRFPYSSNCAWVVTATKWNGVCLGRDEEYTPLSCDLAVNKKGKQKKKICLKKPFMKIGCKWKKKSCLKQK